MHVQEAISEAALDLLLTNAELVFGTLKNENEEAARFLASIFRKYRSHRRDEFPSAFARAEDISNDDSRGRTSPQFAPLGGAAIPRAIPTGIYQVFRRFKPTRAQKANKDRGHDWSNPRNHVVVCELLHLNAVTMTCLMVTDSLDVYHGRLYCDDNDIICAYMLSPNPVSNIGGVRTRFAVLKSEKRSLSLRSALIVKAGDTTLQPVAADILLIELKRDSHVDLYSAFEDLLLGSVANSVEEDSLIADYIAISPPDQTRDHPEWSRVRYVKDFPALMELLDTDWGFFQEPIRTAGVEELSTMRQHIELELFRQSRSVGDRN